MPATTKNNFPYNRLFALFLLPLLGLIDLSHAQPTRNVSPPSLRVGDTWEYRHYQFGTGKLNRTRVEVVTRAQADSVRIRQTDSTGEPPSEKSMTTREMYNWNWPLIVGKKWMAPIVKDGKTIGEIKYVVQGWESVSTTAGTFETLRIENAFVRPEGSFRQVIWYAPAARNFVRLYYLDEHGRPDQAVELTRFKLQ